MCEKSLSIQIIVLFHKTIIRYESTQYRQKLTPPKGGANFIN